MRITRLGLPGLITFVLLLLWSGVLTVPTLAGLPATPAPTLLLVPTLQALMFLSGAIALGGALVGGVLGGDARVRQIGMRSALVFAGSSLAVLVATLADVLAVEWWQALKPTMLMSFATQVDEGRYLLLQVVLSVSAALMLQRIEHGIDAAFAVLLLIVATTLPGFTGHSTAAVTHWLASTTMIVHLAAMGLWVGGVIVLLAVPDTAALQRFERVGLAAYALLLLSGVASVFERVTDWGLFWQDRYALVLGGKVLIALALGGVAHGLRARAGDGDEAVRRRLGVQVSLMLVVLAFAVVLARMPNP